MAGSASGAAIVAVAMRWTDRLLGLVSTIILARLLVPADFGIVAMATLVIGLLDIVLNLGVSAALVQNTRATQEHFDTAWTLRLAQAGLSALLAAASVPLAIDYYHEPRVGPVMYALAASLAIGAFENIGIVTFQKTFAAGRDFQFLFSKRLVGVTVTLVAAAVWRSYWALIAGIITTNVAGVMLSYRMSPMRPRLSLARLSEILGFSSWMLARNIIVYLNNRLHTLTVGGRAPAATLGHYNMANDLAALPSSELLAPLSRVLLPAFARVKDDPVRLKETFLTAQGIQVLIAVPCCVGLTLVAGDVVPLMLGPAWLPAIEFLQWASLVFVTTAISTSGGYLLLATGRPRLSIAAPMLQLLVFAVAAYGLWPDGGAEMIVRQRLLAACTGLLVFFAMILRVGPGLRATDLVGSLWRPALGAAIMTGVVLAIGSVVGTATVPALLAKVAGGAFSYVGVVAAGWLLAGRPAGAESFLIGKLEDIRRRRTTG